MTTTWVVTDFASQFSTFATPESHWSAYDTTRSPSEEEGRPLRYKWPARRNTARK